MNHLQNKQIFIIDDDPFWAATLSKMLKDLGYTNIVKFSGGTDCVNNLHLNPALVFLDYQMEDMDGLEVLQKVKNYSQGIGVIFCTAHEDLSVAVDAMKIGSFDYLLKSNASKKEVANIIDQMNDKQVFTDKVY
jgi:DNA-binding NtrC family response regulator